MYNPPQKQSPLMLIENSPAIRLYGINLLLKIISAIFSFIIIWHCVMNGKQFFFLSRKTPRFANLKAISRSWLLRILFFIPATSSHNFLLIKNKPPVLAEILSENLSELYSSLSIRMPSLL